MGWINCSYEKKYNSLREKLSIIPSFFLIHFLDIFFNCFCRVDGSTRTTRKYETNRIPEDSIIVCGSLLNKQKKIVNQKKNPRTTEQNNMPTTIMMMIVHTMMISNRRGKNQWGKNMELQNRSKIIIPNQQTNEKY